MRLKTIDISYINYSTIKLEWRYLPYDGISTNNFTIRIGVSGSSEGPFTQLAELESNNVYFIHQRIKKKWLDLYYRIEIWNNHTNESSDFKTFKLEPRSDVLVKRAREKYHLYLSKRTMNPVRLYKKKKTGEHCKECWDPIKSQVKKEDCETCFGTGYGNDSVFGLDSVSIDGWLKPNIDGDLEFYHKNSVFDNYPMVSNQTDFVSTMEEYGIHSGDEFRMETNDGTPIFSFFVKGVDSDRLTLDYNGENIYDALPNCKFSVYKLNTIQEGILNTKLIIGPETINFYHYGLFLDENYSKLVFVDENETEITFFNVLDIGEDYLKLDDEGNIRATKNAARFYIEDSSGDIMVSESIESLFLSIDREHYLIMPNTSLSKDDRFYINYQYDGANYFIINGKNTKISESNVDVKSLALLTISEVEKAGVYDINISTLSNYEVISEPTTTYTVYNFCIDRFCKSIWNYSIQQATYAKSHYKVGYRITENNQTFNIYHKYVLKTGFEGTGVLLIDIQKGITYRAQTYNADGSYENDGDFYFNPDTGEIDTKELPEGNYELSYIYDVRELNFDSIFTPINPVLSGNTIESVGGWYFRSNELKNITLIGSLNISLSSEDIYKSLVVENFISESGVLQLKPGTFDPNMFFMNLNTDTTLSIDYKNSGGYYQHIDGFMMVTSPTYREETLTPEGVMSTLDMTAVVEYIPTIEPDDVLFDETLRRFYTVLRAESKMFRRRSFVQVLFLREKRGREQEILFKLLDRTNIISEMSKFGDSTLVTTQTDLDILGMTNYSTSASPSWRPKNKFYFNEIPNEIPDDIIVDFTISSTPDTGPGSGFNYMMIVSVNGIVQTPGLISGNDYTFDAETRTITFAVPPSIGANILVTYISKI